jgi:hypothetical protein
MPAPSDDGLDPFGARFLTLAAGRAIVTRNFQYARTAAGGSVLWLGRRKRVGRGEGVSDLRYDILERVRT